MLSAVILAAGKATRLHSDSHSLPKALRPLAQKPLLAHVLTAVNFIPPRRVCLVIGYRGEMVQSAMGESYAYALQDRQWGTGHAVMCARPFIENCPGPVLVALGDMPLLRRESYRALWESHQKEKAACTLATVMLDPDSAFGRVLRDETGRFQAIREAKDCTSAQREIRETNVGLMIFEKPWLLRGLEKLDNRNAQNEYYLTDVPGIIAARGGKVHTHTLADPTEALGVNTPEELALAEQICLQRQKRG